MKAAHLLQQLLTDHKIVTHYCYGQHPQLRYCGQHPILSGALTESS